MAVHPLWLQVVLGVFLPLIGFTLVLNGLVFLLHAAFDIGTTFRVSEHGLLKQRFGRCTFFRWDQVKEVFKNSSNLRHPGGIRDLRFAGCSMTLDDGTRLLVSVRRIAFL